MPIKFTQLLVERRTFRARTRMVQRAPADAGAHLARLHAALQLGDIEPLQGTLADIFVALPATDIQTRKTALQMTNTRISPYVSEAFAQSLSGEAIPVITALATRWSVHAQPSANVAARLRRASPDQSRTMAKSVVDALQLSDPTLAPEVERNFLDHCISCQDKLAFMLASRDLRRYQIALNERWNQVALWLEEHNTHGARQDPAPYISPSPSK